MAKTPREVAVRQTDAAEPLGGVGASASNTSSGEHNKLDAVRCPHCTEAHPPTYSHCPRTGKPLQTGPALVGRIIAGRYRVTGILGEGGMGAVYIAEHLLLGRKVAIKRLHPELTGDEKAVARFQREARAAAATGHEHIVEVLDLGYAEDGAPYLVMEYLRGVALAQVLKQEGRLPLARAANIIGQVLAALAAVHQREIVHRDLKPDNVFLTRRGGVQDYVKVLDFGISKMKQDEGEPTNLTRTGVTMGTPYYMSPEQARGMRKLDHRVDLYAVAVMMYECLTGRLPLMGDNYHALLQQILRVEPLPPSSIVPGLPAALDAVLLKGLAKDPAQRFSSAAEMLEALTPFGARAGDLTAMVATQPVSIAKLEEAARVDVRAPTEAAASSGALGSGALGSGALGSGALGSGALGSGALGSGALGSGALGSGALAGPPAPSAPIAASSPMDAGPAAREAVVASAGDRPARDTGSVRRSELGRAVVPPTPSGPMTAPALAGPPTPGAPEARPARAIASRLQPPKTASATGPRYFLAASEDWTGAPERVSRAQATTPGPATPLGSSAANSSTSLPRLAPPPERPTAEAPIPPARDSAPKPAREEVSVKGALVVALLDHLETELGSATASLTIGSIEPQLRAKLEGVILPMAWLPLGLFEALLGAVDRDHPESTRAGAAGRAAAERELSTTHRLFLQTATPASVLERLPHLHRVYFSKGEAKVVAATVGTKVELDGLGVESPGLVAWLAGFWQRMLELAGARDVKIVATTCRAHRDERSSVTLRWR